MGWEGEKGAEGGGYRERGQGGDPSKEMGMYVVYLVLGLTATMRRCSVMDVFDAW